MWNVPKIRNSLSINLVTRLSVSRFATSRDAQVHARVCAYRHVYSIRVAKATKRVSVRVRFPPRPLKSSKCNGAHWLPARICIPRELCVQGVLLIPAYSDAWDVMNIEWKARYRLGTPWCRIFVENEEILRSSLRFVFLFQDTIRTEMHPR